MLKKFILIGSLAVLFLTPLSSYARTVEDRLATQSIIVQEAVAVGVDPGLAIFLAAIESDFDHLVKNRAGSSARGLYQFIDSTWYNLCSKNWQARLDPVMNTRCAMKLIAAGKISHWTADPHTKRRLRAAGFITEYGQLAYRD